MNVLYLILLGVAAILLLMDAFSESTRRRFTLRLLPLALFFWVLVAFIQVAKSI